MTSKRKRKQPPDLIELPNDGPYRVYAAYRDPLPSEDTDHLHIWCECGQRHTHGAAGKTFGSGDGGRAPHCLDRGKPEGRPPYVIQEVSMLPKEWRGYL